jgi:RNA polymerase sigma factor (sigma-70 family)
LCAADGGCEGNFREADGMISLLEPHTLRRLVGSTAGRLFARVGPAHVHEIEDCVQDALVRALEMWPYHGVPHDPGAWLARVAWNRWIDRHRRRRTEKRAVAELALEETTAPQSRDDTVTALFVGASLGLPPTARVPLTLRLACGLGPKEIAQLLDLSLATVEKRLTRGRSALAKVNHANVVIEDLATVLETLAALFTAGVEAMPDDRAMGAGRVSEALYLIDDVVAHPQLSEQPAAWACAAWMRLTAARLPARTNHFERVSFRSQDRSRWSGELLRLGFEALQHAARAKELSVWHLMAGISALHAEATNWESTNWPRVRGLYQDLVRMRNSPGDSLGLAVAIWRTDGPKAALRWLSTRPLKSAMYFSLLAELSEDLGLDASAHWAEAQRQARTPADLAFYRRRAQATS